MSRDTLDTLTSPRGLIARIVQDTDPESPRDWDNAGTMACWHPRYHLGDEQPTESPSDWLAAFTRDNPGAVILPLYLYDHSGLTIRCAPFSCPWDSGQVSYVYATRDTILKEWGGPNSKRLTPRLRACAESCLRSEVSTYDEYLTGQVYGILIESPAGDNLDSCFGGYGLDYTREEAARMLAHADAADAREAADESTRQACAPACD